MSTPTQTLLIKELITHLHQYGASTDRIEGAVSDVAIKMGLKAQVMASATGAWLSVEDPSNIGRPITHIMRLPVGSVNLGKLADADKIAEDIGNGDLRTEEALERLRALDQPETLKRSLLTVFCCGLASAAVPALFPGTGFADLFSSFFLGLVSGLILLGAGKWNRFSEVSEALVAFLVTILAWTIHYFIAPLSMNVVVVAGLIALMPGLSLTTAVAEMSSGQLTAGMARFGGAVVVLVKLTFGAVLGFGLINWLGINHGGATHHLGALPEYARGLALFLGAISFAGLFRAKKEHVVLVALSVLMGHFVANFVEGRAGGVLGILPVGVLVAAFFVTLLSNAFGTIFKKPGAIIRLPGIIMLVPGSLGFKAGQSLWSEQMSAGGDLIILASATIVSLLAGILIGNMIWPARRL